jgi:hypothetical protein
MTRNAIRFEENTLRFEEDEPSFESAFQGMRKSIRRSWHSQDSIHSGIFPKRLARRLNGERG